VNVLQGIRKKNLEKKGIKIINKDLVIFLFFLLLSFIFWYLNSLEKEIESDVKFPVRYLNVPKGRVVVETIPDKLILYLRGSGYSILKLKVSNKGSPVVIDFSKVNYKRVPDSKKTDYYLVTSMLNKSLSVQLGAGCEITSIKPDTLFFTLEKGTSPPSDRRSNGIKESKKK